MDAVSHKFVCRDDCAAIMDGLLMCSLSPFVGGGWHRRVWDTMFGTSNKVQAFMQQPCLNGRA